MLINVSVVGTLTFKFVRRIVCFSKETVILHLFLLICKHGVLPSGR